jgi:hypothetical protein
LTFNLVSALIPLSVKKNQDCLLEWELYKFDILDRYGEDQCICGHDIQRRFFIRNKLNKNESVVGSCCINRIDAPNLKLHFRSKSEYLESALVMSKTQGDSDLVNGLLSKWNECGSALLVSTAQAQALERITGKKWKAQWTFASQFDRCPICGKPKKIKYDMCYNCGQKSRYLER